jgi:hypothetical protein
MAHVHVIAALLMVLASRATVCAKKRPTSPLEFLAVRRRPQVGDAAGAKCERSAA